MPWLTRVTPCCKLMLECFCRVYEQQRSMKIDLLRTASVFVPASSRQGSIVSLAVPRWKRVPSVRKKGGDPRTGQAKTGDDSDPRLATQRDFVLTATASRPEAVGWAPLVGRPADYLPSGTVGQWLPAPCNGGTCKRAATPEPTKQRKGTTRTLGWQPKETAS